MSAYVCEATQCAAVRTQLRSMTTPLQRKPKELKSATCHGADTDVDEDCPLTPHSDAPHVHNTHQCRVQTLQYNISNMENRMLAKVWDSGMK